MRRFGVVIATVGLGAAMLLVGSSDAWAWRSGWRGGGWHGGGWHGGWGGGWRGVGWRGGWAGGGWGWNRPGWGWGGGWGPGYAGLGLGWAATSPYWGSGWNWGYGWPNSSYYGPGYAYGYRASPTYYGAYQAQPYYAYPQAAPVVTGRSVMAGNIGMHCATSVKTCLLRNASYVGVGCSCKVTGGRARGAVAP